MQAIMIEFHKEMQPIAGYPVIRIEDYSFGLNNLPKSDVLKFIFDSSDATGSIVKRPSGTEPKLKTYLSVMTKSKSDAERIEKEITTILEI